MTISDHQDNWSIPRAHFKKEHRKKKDTSQEVTNDNSTDIEDSQNYADMTQRRKFD